MQEVKGVSDEGRRGNSKMCGEADVDDVVESRWRRRMHQAVKAQEGCSRHVMTR